MKVDRFLFLFLICLYSSTTFTQSSRDTIGQRFTKTFCLDINGIDSLISPYGLDSFSLEWSNLDTISTYFISKSDTVILKAKPRFSDTLLVIDTFFIEVSYEPTSISFSYTPDCYPLGGKLENNSVYHPNTRFIGIAGMYSYGFIDNISPIKFQNLPNGDTLSLFIKAETKHCPTITDTLTVFQKFKPELDFEMIPGCSGFETKIINNSIYDKNISLGEYIFRQESFQLIKDTLKFKVVGNPGSEELKISINQEECISDSTINVINKLEPTIAFSPNPNGTCENELLNFSNSTISISPSSSLEININNNKIQYDANNTNLPWPSLLPDGIYKTIGIVDNKNGCVDSIEFDVIIDPVTEAILNNVQDYYCERQDESILMASPSNGSNNGTGIFNGPDLFNITNSSATFKPQTPGMDIPISYTFTTQYGCVDTETKIVKIVRPKPVVNILGLKPEYCHKDSIAVIMTNQSTGIPNFSVNWDDNLIDQVSEFEYNFDPSKVGIYEIRFDYEDTFGCKNFDIKTTIVNPLPNISLNDSLILTPGEQKQIGVDFIEPNVNYFWSNKDSGPNIDVSLPGIYIVTATNNITSCQIRDSLEVKFDIAIENTIDIIKFGPNPVSDNLSISSTKYLENVSLVNKQGETIRINGQLMVNTDVDGKLDIDLSQLPLGLYCLRIPSVGNYLIIKL